MPRKIQTPAQSAKVAALVAHGWRQVSPMCGNAVLLRDRPLKFCRPGFGDADPCAVHVDAHGEVHPGRYGHTKRAKRAKA